MSNPWTKEELAYLESAWPDTPTDEVAKNIPAHTISVIISKAYRMGFKRSPEFSREQKVQASIKGALAMHLKRSPVPPVHSYGEKLGNARVFRIDHRPKHLEVRELAPSRLNYASGSTLGVSV